MVDFEIDQLNPRKDSFLFGARGTAAQLSILWIPICIVQVLTIPFFIYWEGWNMLVLFTSLFLINALYNLPQQGLRSRPPWELICQVGYLLVVPFSIFVNNAAPLPWITYLYLLLFAFQSHLMGEVMDIEPDRTAGRRTIATQIGSRATKWIIIAIVCCEVLLMIIVFKELIFGAFLGLSLVWLLLDVLLLYKAKTYQLWQINLFGILSNLIAIATMAYVWYSGCLGHID